MSNRSELERTVREQPGDLRARRALGDLYKKEGDVELAVLQYRSLVGAFAAQGLFFRAIAACKLVLELRPDDVEASERLADLYARRTSGKESTELSPSMSSALVPAIPDDDVVEADVVEADAAGVEVEPPPVPVDSADGDAEESVDVDSLAAAMTPLPGGGVRIERPPAVPLFSGLSHESFLELLHKLRAWEAEPGAIIVGEGEQSDSMFVVVRGHVRVERAKDGETVLLARLGPDSFFGELSLLTQRPRAASVVADERCELLEIPRDIFGQLAARDPSVTSAIEGFARVRLLENLVRTSPLFADLPDDAVKDALAAFEGERALPGTILVEKGTVARGLFVVLQGECDVMARSELGNTRLKRLVPGDVFGEMSLVSGEPPQASVVAATDAALLLLPKERFRSFVDGRPAVAERIQRIAATRRAFNARFLPDHTSSASLV